jgi:aminoglycoside phosphotransferase (APT) family kinase protein
VDQDKDWVEATVGGAIQRADRTTAGRSRATWLVDVARPDGEVVELVLRRDTGDGPLSGTELTLERESHVYRALAGTGVPAPRLLGVAPDGLGLLVERVEGTEDLGGLPPEERMSVLDDFVDALVTLHGVDVSGLDLPGFARPVAAEDHALEEIRLWTGVYETGVRRPAPLVALALRWLAEHPPAQVEGTVLCHGDLGPGNFLHADGRVTALLDWEFAHLGDPMDDLAWLSMRATQVAGLDSLDRLVCRYAAASGIQIDPERVAYYQVFVLVRMAIACLVALDKRSGAMDTSTYFALLPLLERQISSALAQRMGVDLVPAEPLGPPARTSRAEVLEAVSADLGNVFAPELQTESVRSRLMGAFLLLSHLSAADGLGPAVDDAELAALGKLLGDRPSTVDAGRRSLVDLIDGAEPSELPAVLELLSQHADRQLALWPAVAAYATRGLLEVRAP